MTLRPEVQASGEHGRDVLRLDRVNLSFSGLHVLRDVALTLKAGEVLALIGPNGAGKSALLNCIGGIYRPSPGSEIRLRDTRIDALPPHRIARLGIGRTFQGLKLMRERTVLDNILLGWTPRFSLGTLGSLAFALRTQREEREARARAHEVADLCGLADVLGVRCADLPLGVLRRVDLARALLGEPQVLLLDEPASGLSHDERPLIGEMVRVARSRKGLSVLWIEHDLDLVLSEAQRAVVLHHGTVVAVGDPAQPDGRAQLLDGYRTGAPVARH
ncbi:ABC transporter ATP-binding protein [Paraburkholderia lycopersici]|uniref:Branched-chain amino acid transport system ATP-binding protein n=1 Tax=Paraburkholderia lycopersici TaxID=416944 RepID=A0A1G6QDN5_9BURK|nr:ATP-binding cassette domain-containing protein [Paraburkholderia lycopersici]SDC89785.1 branched-chain amino acid transport system ATP-binding protein [Paraburkholderia lycopersici]